MIKPLANDQMFLKKLTEITLANLGNENFGAKELARESGLSSSGLNRKLHTITNKTINQFIRETRLQKALEMLQNEEVTASEVAYKVGFSSPAYFNTCFNGYFGYSPGKVKKADFDNTKELSPISVSTIDKHTGNSSQSYILVTSGILLLSFIVYLVYSLYLKSNYTDSSITFKSHEKSIAVLPFKNLSDSASNQYFIDGLMEEILTNLSIIHGLRVISRTSVEQFRKSNKTAPEIGKKLNVGYIVEGSGQKYGNTFRLRIQLIDVSDDRHIWAESYAEDIKKTKDLFNIQNKIAQSIASALKTIITPEEKKLIRKVPTANLTAYDLYLKANDYFKDYQKSRNLNIYNKAITFYNASLEIDSAFAKAYTGLARAYYERYSWENYFKKGFLDSCLFLVNKALSIDNQLDEAYYLKGLYYWENGYTQEALNNLDEALKFNPNFYLAYSEKAHIFSIIHDVIKSIDNHQKALNLVRGDERAPLLWELGWEYGNIGFIEKAKYFYNDALALDSNKVKYLQNLAWIEFSLENFEETIKLFKKINDIDSTYIVELIVYSVPSGHDHEAYLQAEKFIRLNNKAGNLILNNSHRIGFAFWKVGKFKDAKYYFNQQIRYSVESIKLNREIARRNYAFYDLAETYAFLGDKEKAYQYLDEFDKNKSCQLIWVILAKHDPLFDSIRNEERFQKILHNMEAKYQAEHDRVKQWLEDQGNL